MVRSDKYNRYYHKCVKLPVALELGMTPNEVHDMFLIANALIDAKKDCYVVESTSTMEHDRFGMFVEQCKQFVIMELGLEIKAWTEFEDYKTKIVELK